MKCWWVKGLVMVVLAGMYFAPLWLGQKPVDVAKTTVPELPRLQTGDLVVLQGRSFFSDQLRKFNTRDQRYSHCGWLVKEEGQTFVYHLQGDGNRQAQPIQKEPLDHFISPQESLAFGIYRYQMDSTQRWTATSQIKEWQQAGITFDYAFDITTDQQMYCSELIFKAMKSLDLDRLMVNLANVKGKTYIPIDNLYFNPTTTKIFDYAYH